MVELDQSCRSNSTSLIAKTVPSKENVLLKVVAMEERSIEAKESDKRTGTVDLEAGTDVVVDSVELEPPFAHMGLGFLVYHQGLETISVKLDKLIAGLSNISKSGFIGKSRIYILLEENHYPTLWLTAVVR
ncbi:hypothetical protein Ancab_012622 [Ancistrocladus abbreviatus]